jgi:hypothetical protein
MTEDEAMTEEVAQAIVCDECDAQGFDSLDQLKDHANTECPQTCPFCQREGLRGKNSLRSHMTRSCAEAVLGAGPTNTEKETAVLDDADNRQRAVYGVNPAAFRVTNPPPPPLPESVRDTNSPVFNVTHTWYGYVPEVDVTGISTTGLPDEILHTASSWQTHQVQRQLEQGKHLLMPVEKYGMKLRSSPYVHVKPPERDTFNQLVSEWSALLPLEIAVETDLLEQAEMDLERAITREDRALARQRIRIFSTRTHQLAALDFEAIYRFLVREHELSRAFARSDQQILDERIDERIEAQMDKQFMEHVG